MSKADSALESAPSFLVSGSQNPFSQGDAGLSWRVNFADPGANCCGIIVSWWAQASDRILLCNSVGMLMKEGDVGGREMDMMAADPL